MGGSKGSSSGSQQVQLTPEQTRLLGAQTDFLTGTAFPAYQNVLGKANDIYGQSGLENRIAAQKAYGVSEQTGGVQQAAGTTGVNTGMAGLSSLFDPKYEEGQVQAALQAGRESARESQAGQNAMYGATGGLGSSRMALADRNLSSLNAQRQATAAANARAGVQANRANAATSIIGAGQNLANTGLTATGNAITAAQSPMDLYSKYAAVVYGTPQASTTPNFAGTQGTTGTSKGFRI